MTNPKPKKTKTKKVQLKPDPVVLYNMEVTPYNETLYWSWAPTSALFLEEMKRSLPFLKPQEIPPVSNAHCEVFYHEDHWYPVIWCSTPDEPWIIAHELEHFVHWLLKEKGLKFSDDSEEAYCYLLAFLMEMMIISRRKGRYPKIPKSKKVKPHSKPKNHI